MNHHHFNIVTSVGTRIPFALPLLLASTMFFACVGEVTKTDPNNVTSKFNTTWNIYEKCETLDDGSILYKAQCWGGLVGSFLEKNGPADLSAYESITFKFASPTTFPTQIVVANRFKTWGKEGITSLTCNFDGQDVRSVDNIVLQAGDTCEFKITKVYLTPNDATWTTFPVWSGNCVFGNWSGGFAVPAEKFQQAYEGDKLEFIYSADKSDPSVTYWLFKTIYSATDSTLEGNSSELNSWGCALVSSKATVYRIVLTENDVINLREKGLFVNGYHCDVTQCNLLCRSYPEEETME